MIMRQRQELEADCYAATRLAAEHRDAVEAAIRLFTRMGSFRFDRLHPTGSQRAASLLACLAAATDTASRMAATRGRRRGRWPARPSWSWRPPRRNGSWVTSDVIVDGRSMGTISTFERTTSLALDGLANGPRRYEIRLEIFTLDALLEPNPSGLAEGRGTIEVRRGARFEVHWLGEEPPSLLPAGTAAVAGS